MGRDDGRKSTMGRGRPRTGFSNSIMFREVLREDTELCRALLERILSFPIERIEEKHPEYPIDPALSAHGVRCDLYIKGDDKVIDCEMQATSAPAIGRRIRYYQGALDVGILPKGEVYPSLPESYIVFLCREDPFGRSIPRYTIEPVCHEDPSIELRADIHWLVCNASASSSEQDEGMRNLLSYIRTGRVDADDPLICDIDAKVDALNDSDEVMRMVWTQENEVRLRANIAFEEGEAKGRAEGLAEGEARGRSEGLVEGEARLSDLIKALIGAGRTDDVERVASDPAYREALFKEFAIA